MLVFRAGDLGLGPQDAGMTLPPCFAQSRVFMAAIAIENLGNGLKPLAALGREAVRPHEIAHRHHARGRHRCHCGEAQPQIPIFGRGEMGRETIRVLQQRFASRDGGGAHEIDREQRRLRLFHAEEMRRRLLAEFRFPVLEAGAAIITRGAEMAVIGEGETHFRIAFHIFHLHAQFAALPDVVRVKKCDDWRRSY